MAFKLVNKGNNPYDLSSLRWVCDKCGGEKHSGAPYKPIGRKKICTCKTIKYDGRTKIEKS